MRFDPHVSFVLVVALLATRVAAQSSIPVDGTYRFAVVSAEHNSGCGGAGDLLTAEIGDALFSGAGTLNVSSTTHAVCEDGTETNSPSSGASIYVVDSDGTITIDPGTPDEQRVFTGRDLRVLAWAGEHLNQSPSIGVAVRLSSGVPSTILDGTYHFARFTLANPGPGPGTSATLWLGSMTFSGPSFTAIFGIKMIDASGGTSFPPAAGGGTFAVASNGTMSLTGLWGAPAMNGAVTADGSMFFVLDDSGTDVGLLVGMRDATSATSSLLSGVWRGGHFNATPGPSPDPSFCSSSLVATFDAPLATWSTMESQVCEDRLSSTSGTSSSAGTFTVNTDGSTCLLDPSHPPCFAGAVDPTGSWAFSVDFPAAGEIDLVVYVRAATPSIAYCVGDGISGACPCANASPSIDVAGCLNSLALGGRLTTAGTPSLSSDSLVLAGSQMPNASVLYFQGTSLLAGGAGSAFGDGLRCAGGTVIRLGTKTNSGGASQYPGAGDVSVHLRGLVTSPGPRVYQAWYRNAATFCTASTFNLTNGRLVIWSL